MAKPIYVMQDASRALGTGGDVKLVAVQPPSPGDKAWYSVNSLGKISRSTQLRLGGQGVEKMLQATGYVPAEQTPDHAEAVTFLRAYLLSLRGLKMVEEGLARRADHLQSHRGGSPVWVVPFKGDKPAVKVTVAPDTGTRMRSLGIAIGIVGALISTLNSNPSDGRRGDDIDLLENWVVEADETGPTPQDLPRVSEYGGQVEQAAYLICNAGLATLVHPFTVPADDAEVEQDKARGVCTLRLPDGAQMVVSVDALDELVCKVLVGDEPVLSHHGMVAAGKLTFGAVIGSVALVLAQYQDLLAAKTQPKAKPKASAPRGKAKAAAA